MTEYGRITKRKWEIFYFNAHINDFESDKK